MFRLMRHAFEYDSRNGSPNDSAVVIEVKFGYNTV